jgi:hypothetical protein
MAHSDNDARGPEDEPSPMDRSSTHGEDMDVPDPSALESSPDEVHDDAGFERSGDDSTGGYSDDGGMLGMGLATLSLVIGVILFLLPEPVTSTLGLVLIATGAGIWLYKLVT